MRNLYLPLAVALALASCSPPPYPKQYKDLEGKWVVVNLQGGGKLRGWLWSDGSVGPEKEGSLNGILYSPTRVNWDKVLTVTY